MYIIALICINEHTYIHYIQLPSQNINLEIKQQSYAIENKVSLFCILESDNKTEKLLKNNQR